MNARRGGTAPMAGSATSLAGPSQPWLDWKNGLSARLR
jgi:hypothetical protein